MRPLSEIFAEAHQQIANAPTLTHKPRVPVPKPNNTNEHSFIKEGIKIVRLVASTNDFPIGTCFSVLMYDITGDEYTVVENGSYYIIPAKYIETLYDGDST